MDIRKIKKLIEMLQDSDLTEIEVQEGEESVRIVRGSAQPFEVKTTSISPASVNVLSENNEVVANESGSPIKSPIVGTFYRKPAPDKPPFVEIGSQDIIILFKAAISCAGYHKELSVTQREKIQTTPGNNPDNNWQFNKLNFRKEC